MGFRSKGKWLVASTVLLSLFSASAAFASPPVSGISTTEFNEGTDKAAVFFNPLVVSAVDLTFPQSTYNTLNSNPYTTAFQHASVKITTADGVVTNFADVGVRLKGQATRTNLSGKAPFKLKFDAFVPGQKFMGLTRMTLNSMIQDPSFIHEDTIYRLFRAMGVIAPRTTYSWVTVNGTDFGLYMNVESVDSQMLKRWVTPKHLYSSNCYVADITPNKSGCFDTNYGDSDRSDLLAAINVAQFDGEQWWTEVNKVANMTQVINLMATDIYTSNWDGYTDVVQNNYFMVFDDKGKLSIIPWGEDGAFPMDPAAQGWWDGVGPAFRNFSPERSVMLRKCVAYAPCKLLLTKAQVAVKKKVEQLDLIGFKNRVAALINNAYVSKETRSNSDVNSAVWWQNWLDSFFPSRNTSLTTYLNNVNPDVPEVTIKGDSTIGSIITATGSTWDYTTNLSYQWLRDGLPIERQTLSTYQLAPVDENRQISVRVTASKGFLPSASAVSSSIQVASAKAPSAAIAGNAIVGGLLTATPVTNGSIQVAYRWLRNGKAITGATGSTYMPTAADFGKDISVSTTVVQFNYPKVTTTSSTLNVKAGDMTLPTIKVVGNVLVGQSIFAAGTSDVGTKVSFQWLRNNDQILGATKSSYTLKPEDLNNSISVRATFTKLGYNNISITAPAVIAVAGNLTKTAVPTISGLAKVGKTISAVPGAWDTGTVLSYQWYRDGNPVGTNSKSYKLTSADLNASITVSVTGNKAGYISATKTSSAITAN